MGESEVKDLITRDMAGNINFFMVEDLFPLGPQMQWVCVTGEELCAYDFAYKSAHKPALL